MQAAYKQIYPQLEENFLDGVMAKMKNILTIICTEKELDELKNLETSRIRREMFSVHPDTSNEDEETSKIIIAKLSARLKQLRQQSSLQVSPTSIKNQLSLDIQAAGSFKQLFQREEENNPIFSWMYKKIAAELNTFSKIVNNPNCKEFIQEIINRQQRKFSHSEATKVKENVELTANFNSLTQKTTAAKQKNRQEIKELEISLKKIASIIDLSPRYRHTNAEDEDLFLLEASAKKQRYFADLNVNKIQLAIRVLNITNSSDALNFHDKFENILILVGQLKETGYVESLEHTISLYIENNLNKHTIKSFNMIAEVDKFEKNWLKLIQPLSGNKKQAKLLSKKKFSASSINFIQSSLQQIRGLYSSANVDQTINQINLLQAELGQQKAEFTFLYKQINFSTSQLAKELEPLLAKKVKASYDDAQIIETQISGIDKLPKGLQLKPELFNQQLLEAVPTDLADLLNLSTPTFSLVSTELLNKIGLPISEIYKQVKLSFPTIPSQI